METLLSHNQLGYRSWSGRKRLLAPYCPAVRNLFGDPVFQILEMNRFSQTPLNAPGREAFVYSGLLRRERGDFGDWFVGDFSDVRGPGIYQAWCGGHFGPSFAVRDDVYRRLMPLLIYYFQVQSCGRAMPGWHEACHLDDGRVFETGEWVEAAGGWHDAGDFRKWTSSTSLHALSLLLAHRQWKGREGEWNLPADTFLAEAMQGFEYFLGMQNPATGKMRNNVGGGLRSFHDNEDNRFTDNIPRSGDERRIPETRWDRAEPKYAVVFALYASALKSSDPDKAARAMEAARRLLACDDVIKDRSATFLSWKAWAWLELWRLSGESGDQHRALEAMRDLLALQIPPGGSNGEAYGFFRQSREGGGYHRKHVGTEYILWILSEFLESWPTNPEASSWRQAVEWWADGYARFFASRNPFGMLPYALYDSIPAAHPRCRYRQIGEKLWFRYFLAENPFGKCAQMALAAVGLGAAFRITGQEDLLHLAYQQLDWILGANPLMLCLVTGAGVRTPSALSFLMGNIPGGVTMGPGGNDDDLPDYRGGAHPWMCCDEYYGYQQGHFFWAVTSLEKLRPTAPKL